MQIVILCGGLATRLYPQTLKIPKSLMLINNKPFIYWQLMQLKNQNIKNIILCLGKYSEQIIEYLQLNSNFGLKIKYSVENEKLGTGGAISNTYSRLENYFGILYGDCFLDINYKKLKKHYKRKNKLGLMTIYKNNGLYDKSNIVCKNKKIIKYDKEFMDPEMKYIDYGFGILNKELFKRKSGNFDLSIIYQDLIRRDELANYRVKKRFYEIGSFQGIKETEEFLKEI